MPEKEPVIIDGTDVSGCDFLAKEDDYCSYSGEYRAHKGECGCSDGEMCKDYPDCFYKKALKQLAIKTQECEELKSQLTSLSYADTICALEIDLEHKTQECEELKKANDRKNELLAKLGCPTTATAKMKVHCLQEQLDKLKAENETYKKMLDNPEVRVALTDIRTGERDLWQKYKPRMEKAEQKLESIAEIIAPYNIPTKKVCENCIHYVPGSGVCEKDAPQFKHITSQTKTCEAFCYTDDLVPNILANKIKDVIDREGKI